MSSSILGKRSRKDTEREESSKRIKQEDPTPPPAGAIKFEVAKSPLVVRNDGREKFSNVMRTRSWNHQCDVILVDPGEKGVEIEPGAFYFRRVRLQELITPDFIEEHVLKGKFGILRKLGLAISPFDSNNRF